MAGKDNITIISCGTMREDLEKLLQDGVLEDVSLVFTERCLKERPWELEKQLVGEIENAKGNGGKILVVYGDACFYDNAKPERDVDRMIGETGADCARIREHSCIEMMLSPEDKEELGGGQRVYWLMPAWMENRDDVYFEWDLGKRNQTFPQNDMALMVDSRGYFMRLMEENPELILEFSDWMGLALDARDINLDRFRELLLARIAELRGEVAWITWPHMARAPYMRCCAARHANSSPGLQKRIGRSRGEKKSCC